MSYTVPDIGFDLETELGKARAFYREHAIPPEVLAKMDRQTAELIESGTLSGALAIGDRAPDFSLPDANGEPVSLTGRLLEGPVVLTFYRGRWCPYCQLALRNLQQNVEQFAAAGARLIAISPQTPDQTLTTVEKHALTFDVLSDEAGRTARAFGVAFDLPDYLSALYEDFGHGMSSFNDGHEVLPVPATYVIDSEGIVRYAFVSADYTQRADPRDILTALHALRD